MDRAVPGIVSSRTMNRRSTAFPRRTFLQSLGTATASLLLDGVGTGTSDGLRAQAGPVQPCPAIDTHIHIYDPDRPQGVPWPPKNLEVLYSTHLPPRFVTLAEPLGVVGAMVVEASPWVEDNQWVLDIAKDSPIIVGFIGNLPVGQPQFASQLKRFAANPFFRGLRLRDVTLPKGPGEAAFADDIRRLADRHLTLDIVGGTPILADVLRLKHMAPDLRVVIDHLPFHEWDEAGPPALRRALVEVAQLPNVCIKISEVPRRAGGRLIEDADFYRPTLDALWDLFGPDRAFYGSNWPVSDLVAPYADLYKIVTTYFAAKGETAAQKFFWKNSLAAYSWLPRGKAARLLPK
jgi:predicted TIM-barrel fold metal-dependent hydrolase